MKWQVLVLAFAVGGRVIGHAQDNPADIQTHFQRARVALALHDLQHAAQEYAEILRLDPRNVEAYTGRGIALYELGKPTEAVSALQTALQLDVGQITAEVFLGLSKAELGQCVEAIPLLKKNVNEGTEPKLRRLVGLSLLTCYVIRSELDSARDLALTLKKSYPDDPEVLYHLAEVYSRLLNTTVDELLKRHPDSYRMHQIAGEILEAQDNYEQAIKEYRKALEINPNVSRVHYRIGILILLTVRGSEADRQALSEFRQELAINPGDVDSEYQIGEIFRKDHRYEESRQCFLRALELAPDFAEAHIGLARIELEEHQPDSALKELDQAVQLQPKNPSAHYILMLVYRDLGKMQESGREMEVFRSLQAEKDKDFRPQSGALLTGEKAEQEKSR